MQRRQGRRLAGTQPPAALDFQRMRNAERLSFSTSGTRAPRHGQTLEFFIAEKGKSGRCGNRIHGVKIKPIKNWTVCAGAGCNWWGPLLLNSDWPHPFT
ncbi:hypothetical protein AB4Z46_15505 [Variovorax sp. M-6]|uniref:hypothetical protein n=1 Tax=Variovorax sp. M-6 TaxID=3233041 RepID=UPI003F94D11B